MNLRFTFYESLQAQCSKQEYKFVNKILHPIYSQSKKNDQKTDYRIITVSDRFHPYLPPLMGPWTHGGPRRAKDPTPAPWVSTIGAPTASAKWLSLLLLSALDASARPVTVVIRACVCALGCSCCASVSLQNQKKKKLESQIRCSRFEEKETGCKPRLVTVVSMESSRRSLCAWLLCSCKNKKAWREVLRSTLLRARVRVVE